MYDKVLSILERFSKVEESLNNPDIMNDVKQYREINREYKNLKKIADIAIKYKKNYEDLESNKELVKDKNIESELRDMAYEEIELLTQVLEDIESELRILLIPKDPNDLKNCIMEIRAGTGGDEAGIFAGDLFRMYQRFADKKGFQIEIIDFNESEKGGFKEVIFSIAGDDVFGLMKFESGVHRVQRVPETEAQGRVHTSAATVAVLPEAEDIDVDIKEEDLRIDIYRAGGKGGQNVNKVETAVRMIHIPSGIVVQCQEERSQLKNREKAMKVLRSRLYEMELEKQQSEMSSTRKSMVKTGDRSEKIRTYNYPQNRVTDHRLEGEAKNYSLQDVVSGGLDAVIENLQIAERTELLNQGIGA
ncbi:MAG TPA: peptide chain release factor 1 [Candidatus Kapabacteria bacterium]|nr:peptide chain release factor 1 [Candidatus Kapabacteria bacterium]